VASRNGFSIRGSLVSLRDNEERATRGPPSNPPMQEMGCFHYSYVLYLMEFSCKKKPR
jgi:hypothetical protein